MAKLIIVLALLVGCEEGKSRQAIPGDEQDGAPTEGEAEDPDGEGGEQAVDAAPERPAGTAAIWIAVDDRAAGTYDDGQLKWNGSFEWDEASNTVMFSASWLPTERPYPVLRDDGPLSAGGHEPEGQLAGDGIHSTVVLVDASAAAQTFEFGIINELDNWIWVGPNGTLTVPEGSSGSFEAAGLAIEGFGDVDVRIVLDAAQLDPLVYPEGLPVADPKVYLKGTLSNWGPVLVRDDGRKGDAEAGDGLYTYLQSERLGAHEGLLSVGQQAQFVWVHLFDPEGDVKEIGREYKATAEALPDGVPTFEAVDPERRSVVYASPAGVTAASRAPGGAWTVQDVGFALESRGATWNTAVEVMPTPADESGGDEGGEEGGETEVGQQGEEGDVGEEGEQGEQGDGDEEGDVGQEGQDGGEGQGSGEIDVLLIEPAFGPSGGGTLVVVTGRGFGQGAVVTFGGDDCSGVVVSDDGRSLECRTPAHAVGPVEVRVALGEDFGVFRDGFSYREGAGEVVGPDWAALWTPHRVTTVAGLPTPDLFCRVYAEGVTEADGDGGALCEVGFGPDGSHPARDGDDWTWASMRFAAQQDNDDEYVGSLVSDESGIFDLAVRVSMDNGRSWVIADQSPQGLADGYAPADAGSMTVQPAPAAPTIVRIEPNVGSFAGGGAVVIHGFHLGAADAVRIGGVDAPITESLPTSVTVQLPPGNPGLTGVAVDLDDDTLTLFRSFRYDGPAVDGHVDDWPLAWWVAEAAVQSTWGAANELYALGGVSDGEHLWIAVRGQVEAANVVVGYVDLDPGAGTGVADASALSDGDGALDIALSGPISLVAQGVGAELAFGTVGMASAEGFDGAAGWRGLDPPDDFAWFDTPLIADGELGIIETRIALPEGVGDEVAVAVRIGNAAGEVLSNQCLPEDDPDLPGSVSVFARIPVP